jgi:RimJ/RimL family protein N-acetyltransferase
VSAADPATGQLSTYAFPDELSTDGLLVRAVVEDDLPVIAPAFVDPAVGGDAGLPPFTEDTLRRVMREELPALRSTGLLAAYVVVDDASEDVLGGLTLHHLDRMRDAVEVGYWLFVHARGRGVATRAVESVVAHAFGHGIHRVEAHVRIGNAASERVLERARFVREGVRRRFLRAGGDGSRRYDATLFARLADD